MPIRPITTCGISCLGRDFVLEGKTTKVIDIRNAVQGDTYDGKELHFRRGIEVGQVFKLGTKYSAKLNATFLDEAGKTVPALMGCYGIGINRIMASAIETSYDDNGIIWPISIAPFEVLLTSVNPEDPDVAKVSGDLYAKLTAAGLEVLWDDRSERAGVKFKDADLIGIPVRLTVGKKGLSNGIVELKLRTDTDRSEIGPDEAVEKIQAAVKTLYQAVGRS